MISMFRKLLTTGAILGLVGTAGFSYAQGEPVGFVKTVSGDEAFMPLSESTCPAVKK